MNRELHEGAMYRHFKGGMYQVLFVALHTETQEELVIYRSLENGQHFARPKDMFLGEVDHEKYPEIDQKYRMAFIEQGSDDILS